MQRIDPWTFGASTPCAGGRQRRETAAWRFLVVEFRVIELEKSCAGSPLPRGATRLPVPHGAARNLPTGAVTSWQGDTKASAASWGWGEGRIKPVRRERFHVKRPLSPSFDSASSLFLALPLSWLLPADDPAKTSASAFPAPPHTYFRTQTQQFDESHRL